MSHKFSKRRVESYSPDFRLETANPQMGFNGAGVYDFYGRTDNGDVSLQGLCQGGIYHFYNDRTIEIVAGSKK